MSRKNQHVVPLGNGWAVKAAGAKHITVITTTQSQAISYARNIAKRKKVILSFMDEMAELENVAATAIRFNLKGKTFQGCKIYLILYTKFEQPKKEGICSLTR